MDISSFLDDLSEDERSAVLKSIETEQKNSLREIPDKTRAWLALAPVWTPALATRASLPIPSGRDAGEVLRLAHDVGLCEVGAIPVAPRRGASVLRPNLNNQTFHMTAAAREETIERIRDRSGQRGLRAVLAKIGTQLKRANSALKAGVPEAVAHWSTLAAEVAPGQTDARGPAKKLDAEIDRILAPIGADGRPPSTDVGGKALGWIEAARPLEYLLQGKLTASIDRAARLLDLFNLRSPDLARLSRFFSRVDQLGAFRELVDEKKSSEEWALHYYGAGEWARRC